MWWTLYGRAKYLSGIYITGTHASLQLVSSWLVCLWYCGSSAGWLAGTHDWPQLSLTHLLRDKLKDRLQHVCHSRTVGGRCADGWGCRISDPTLSRAEICLVWDILFGVAAVGLWRALLIWSKHSLAYKHTDTHGIVFSAAPPADYVHMQRIYNYLSKGFLLLKAYSAPNHVTAIGRLIFRALSLLFLFRYFSAVRNLFKSLLIFRYF